MLLKRSFNFSGHAVVVGARGGIGSAIVQELQACPGMKSILCTARCPMESESGGKLSWMPMDLEDEASIQRVAQVASQRSPLSLVFVASGILHGDGFFPERALKEIQAKALERLLRVNTVGPALVAKHFVPLMPKRERGVFACLGARVGSIGDNRAGGWFAYRASKAALVMMVKTLSIELRRTHPELIALALHPGTVRSDLSAPFVGPNSKRVTFSSEQSAKMLLQVVSGALIEQSGSHLAYDGSSIEA